MGLHAIAYVSAAARPLSVQELEDLLVEARERNLKHSISGVLLHNEGSFMQYFEGVADDVALVYELIKASRQHCDLLELFSKAVERREFGEWTMASAYAGPSEMLAISSASWKRMYTATQRIRDTQPGLSLLHGFWQGVREYAGR